MRFCRVPPGEDAFADAYNLAVCAYMAQHAPQLADYAERMADEITKHVTDWIEVSGYLALLAAKGFAFADQAMPEHRQDGSAVPRPSVVIAEQLEKNYPGVLQHA
jgi:hypothetical protein